MPNSNVFHLYDNYQLLANMTEGELVEKTSIVAIRLFRVQLQQSPKK